MNIEKLKVELSDLYKDSGVLGLQSHYDLKVQELTDCLSQFCYVSILSLLSLSIERTSKEVATKRFGQNHLEFCQAIILTIEYTENVRYPLESEVHFVKHLLIEIFLIFNTKCYLSVVENDKNIQSQEYLQAQIRIQTNTYRNWFQPKQVYEVSRGLYEHLLSKYSSISFQTYSEIYTYLLQKLHEASNDKTILEDYLDDTKSLTDLKVALSNMYDSKIIDVLEKQCVSTFEVVDKKSLLLTYESTLKPLYVSKRCLFTKQDLIKNTNAKEKEVVFFLEHFVHNNNLKHDKLEHFHNNNPVWLKPVLQVSDTEYFCPEPIVLFSFIDEIVSDLVGDVNLQKLRDHKAIYLENKVYIELCKVFSKSNIVRNCKWSGKQNGKIVGYENDILVKVDDTLLIVEAKSGGIKPEARRGADLSLKEVTRKLFFNPCRQSERLENTIMNFQDNEDKKNLKKLSKKLGVVISDVREVIRLNVTLKDLPYIQSNTKRLLEIFDYDISVACPTMSLSDFISVCDILNDPVFFLDYLKKRFSLEKSKEYNYETEEINLLDVYLKELSLNFESRNVPFCLTGKWKAEDYLSDILRVYKKPKPSIPKNYIRLIDQFRNSRTYGWMSVCRHLLSFHVKNIEDIVNDIDRLKSEYRFSFNKIQGLNYPYQINSKTRFIFICSPKYGEEILEATINRLVSENFKGDHAALLILINFQSELQQDFSKALFFKPKKILGKNVIYVGEYWPKYSRFKISQE